MARWRRAPWLLIPILLLAAGNFLWQLATPSYFADEVLSIWNASPSLSHVITAVNKTEINPWTYFFFLHEYLGHTGAQEEWSTRILSVIIGIGVVAAVYWLARAFLPVRGALAAAALCAFSPLVLQYAQQVRGYILVMLATALAIAATIRAVERETSRNRLLILGGTAAVAALLLHYFAVLVIGPLCIWLLMEEKLTHRQRGTFVSACAIAGLLTFPLFLEQLKPSGLQAVGALNWSNAASVIGTPFDGRFLNPPDAIRILGAIAAIAAIARLLTYGGATVPRARLLGVLGLVPIIGILIIGAAGQDLVSTRYTALAAPVEIVVVAAAILTLRALPAIGLTTACVFLVAWGTAVSHSRAGFYPAAKQAMTYIGQHRQAGDLVTLGVRVGVHWPFQYYGSKLLHPAPSYLVPNDASSLSVAVRQRRRMWIINTVVPGKTSDAALLTYVTRKLRPFGYEPSSLKSWTTSLETVAYLATPIGRRPAGAAR